MKFYTENVRWLLGGFLLTFFSAYGQTFFVSIWGEEIRGYFSLSHGEFGTIYMVATLLSALCLPFVGRLVDLYPVSRCVVITLLFLSLGCFLMTYIRDALLLLVALFLLRLFGQGMMGHVAMTAMARWYARNRGKAIAASTIGLNFSEALAPSFFVFLALLFDWRFAWLIAGLSLVFFALPLIYFLMRVERIPRSVEDPLGTHLDASEREDSVSPVRDWTRGEVVRDIIFWVICVGILSPPFIGTSIWFHQDYLIALNGWNPKTYYGSFALMASMTVFSAFLSGFAIDRFGAVRLLPFFGVPLGLACLVLGFFSSSWAIFLTMFLVGTSYGLSHTLFSAVWAEAYGTLHLGAIRSLVMAMMVFASALGPGATGILIDIGFAFTDQLVYLGFWCFFCVLLMMFAVRRLTFRLNFLAVSV